MAPGVAEAKVYVSQVASLNEDCAERIYLALLEDEVERNVHQSEKRELDFTTQTERIGVVLKSPQAVDAVQMLIDFVAHYCYRFATGYD